MWIACFARNSRGWLTGHGLITWRRVSSAPRSRLHSSWPDAECGMLICQLVKRFSVCTHTHVWARLHVDSWVRNVQQACEYPFLCPYANILACTIPLTKPVYMHVRPSSYLCVRCIAQGCQPVQMRRNRYIVFFFGSHIHVQASMPMLIVKPAATCVDATTACMPTYIYVAASTHLCAATFTKLRPRLCLCGYTDVCPCANMFEVPGCTIKFLHVHVLLSTCLCLRAHTRMCV